MTGSARGRFPGLLAAVVLASVLLQWRASQKAAPFLRAVEPEPVPRNATAIPRGEEERPPWLLHCGGRALNRNLRPALESLLPEYEWIDLRPYLRPPAGGDADAGDWRSRFDADRAPHNATAATFREADVFVSNYEMDECAKAARPRPGPGRALTRWIVRAFPGRVLFWTPEDGLGVRIPDPPPRRPFYLGPPQPEGTPEDAAFRLTFLQAAFWARIPREDRASVFARPGGPLRFNASVGWIDPEDREFLVYAHSNCVPARQAAFRAIEALSEEEDLPPPHYAGRCDGHPKRGGNRTTRRAIRYPNGVRLANWEDNARTVYPRFRFCLAMEHVVAPGYATEKLVTALWAGCVPIYAGPPEVLEVFHPAAMVVWNATDPSAALARISALETNRTAYREVLAAPVLLPGVADRHLSLDGQSLVGGGGPPAAAGETYFARFREHLGLPSIDRHGISRR